MPQIVLKPGEDRRLRAGHLWVFSNEIASIDEEASDGLLVDVMAANHHRLGKAYYNQHSLIAARLLTGNDVPIDAAFFRRRIERAEEYRHRIYPGSRTYRAVYSEGDYLPGLIVDRYEDYLSVQVLTLGMERLTEPILDALKEIYMPKGIVLRNDSPFRDLEGLPGYVRIAHGDLPERIEISENGLIFMVEPLAGQKTGFFLDQRENRLLVRSLARDRRVLDCFSYTGGFSVNALAGGAASVLAIDINGEALQLAAANAARNNLEKNIRTETADVFEKLRQLSQNGETFDLIILDPPAFVKSKAKLGPARRGYREINLSAMKLLSQNGILFTCSCSHHLSPDDFLKTLRGAARDAKRRFRLLGMSTQAGDHPILLSMPETQYLKGVVLQALA